MDLWCSFTVHNTWIIPSTLIGLCIIFVFFRLQGIYYYFYQLLKNISDDGLDIAYERLYRRISDRGCPTAVNDAERKQDLVGSSEMLVHVRGLLHPICVREFDERSKFSVLNLCVRVGSFLYINYFVLQHGGQICRRDLGN